MRPTLRAPRPVIPTSAVLLLFLSVPLIVFASAVNPEPVLLQQPDGSRFWARNWGDEWLSGTETLDGYTILRHPKTRAWVYAQKDAEGNLVPSSLVVGLHLPLGIPRHLRPEPSPAAPTAQFQPPSSKSGLSPYLAEKLNKKLEGKLEKRGKNSQPYMHPAEAQQYFFEKRVPPGQKTLPVERYVQALEQMKQMPMHSTRLNELLPPSSKPDDFPFPHLILGSWTWLGPGNIGGRTRALLIHPTTPNTMYAAGVAGGVWKTTNGGTSWTAISDLIANLAVNSLAMDPANPDVIYAGTGEGYFNFDAVRGNGIFKTTNGGISWTHLSSTSNNSNFYFVNDIVLSPKDSNRVYAATWSGVWRSTDAGTTWSRILAPQSKVNAGFIASGGCTDLAIRTDLATDVLFTACGPFEQASIYRTTDAGAPSSVWAEVYTEPNMGRTSLAIAPSSQDTIYALMASNESGNFKNGLLAVIRSTTGGAAGTWSDRVRNTNPTKRNTLLLTNPIIGSLGDCGQGTNKFLNQGWYDNVIAVDPANSNRVWVGGIDLFRSADGAANWEIASYWWFPTTSPRYAHADHHAIVFHPSYNGTTNETMYVGNDGGLFRTDNAVTGSTDMDVCGAVITGTLGWTELNNNYGVTQFYHGLPYPGGTTYLGGTQDNGTLRGTDASGSEAWLKILGGDGGYVAVDPTNTNLIYLENTNLSLRKCTGGNNNPPTGCTQAITGIDPAIDPSDNFLFIAPFIMDPSNSQRLWIGGRFIWRTDNAAASWTQASTEIADDPSFPARSNKITAFAVAQGNSDKVIVGTQHGLILKNTVATTATFSTFWSSSQPRDGFVSWLAFDPANQMTVYATISSFNSGPNVGHVFKSTDGGAIWTDITNNLPDVPVHTIVVDPSNTLRLYVGTDVGVFASTDGGATWAVENTGFANVITEALAIGAVGATPNIFAFTHGRGAWRIPLGGGIPTVSNDNFANATVVTTTPFTDTVNTTAATMEPGDPIPSCGNRSRDKSVWYRFTPASNGTITADTLGSNYDTILSAWTGSPGTFAEVACNDDVAPNTYSRVSFPATAGTTYSFMVTAFGNDGGTLVFNLAFQGTGDTTPPDTTITSGPSGTITTNGATFAWTGSDNVTPTANLVYAFRLDPLEPNFSAFTLATSKSYSNLANGTYTFYVKASDEAGNQDPTPATRTFTVQVPVTDTTPPDTTITSGPTGTLTINSATFSWTGSDNVTPTANLTYATQLHPLEAGFSPFSSATSKTYSAIPNGTYTFFVVARDLAGNTDPTPASRTFTVTVTGTPMIEFDPTTLAFNAVEGGSNPASKTLNIFNAGTGTLNWSVSGSKPWLILSPTSGTSTGQFNPVTVSVNIAGLTDGGHGADIVISAPGAANSPRTVRVSVAVDPRPRATYFVPHIVSGDGFVTKMTVMNLSENANDVAVNFFSQAGRLLETQRFVLPPGGTQRIPTREQDRFAPPTIRWATLDAPFALGINLFFELQHTGSDRMVTSVGFNDVPPLQEFALPVELEPARPGDPAPRTVGLALANVSGSSNSVLLKLIDQEGKVLAQETKTLGPFAQTALNIEALPSFKAALPAGNFVGVVTVSATRLLSAIGVGDDFGPFFSIPVITGRAGTLLIPHIVTGGGFVTKMTIVNLSANPNDIVVKFFSQSGTLLETTPLTLPPYGTRRISTPEGERFASATTRWATIEAPSPVGVNLFFELKQPGSARIDTTVGFNDASPMRDFTLPLELEPARPGDPAPRTVGLALANPSSSSCTVTLKLVDRNGNVLAIQTQILGPFAQTAFTIDTLPPFRTELPTGNFIGVLTVSATGPLSAIGVGDDFGPFFSIPIIPGRAR